MAQQTSTPEFAKQPMSQRQAMEEENKKLMQEIDAIKAMVAPTPQPIGVSEMSLNEVTGASPRTSAIDELTMRLMEEIGKPSQQAPGYYTRVNQIKDLQKEADLQAQSNLDVIQKQIEDYKARSAAQGPDLSGLAALGDVVLGTQGTAKVAQSLRGPDYMELVAELEKQKMQEQNRLLQLQTQLANAIPMGTASSGGMEGGTALLRTLMNESGTTSRYEERRLDNIDREFTKAVQPDSDKLAEVNAVATELVSTPNPLIESLVARIVGTFKGGNVLSDQDVKAFKTDPAFSNEVLSTIKKFGTGESFTDVDKRNFGQALGFIKKAYERKIRNKANVYERKIVKSLGRDANFAKKFIDAEAYLDREPVVDDEETQE